MTEKEWHIINTLRVYLSSFNVIQLVDDFYLKQHGNENPGYLLKDQLELINHILENKPSNINNAAVFACKSLIDGGWLDSLPTNIQQLIIESVEHHE
jgi:hypothetical protein